MNLLSLYAEKYDTAYATSGACKILRSSKTNCAIFALEGFKPTKLRKASVAAIIAGRVTTDQICREIAEHAKNKGLDKFRLNHRDQDLYAKLLATLRNNPL